MRRVLLSALMVLTAVAFVPWATAEPAPVLHAGAAVVDITPRLGGTTLGYVRPDMPVDGVHTRLMGRALVLDDGDTEVVLLATDLAFPLEKDSLVARVADLGFTHETVLYTGTHTHSGPQDLADWQVEQLARAVREAHAAKEPAKAAWGSARVSGVNRNRSIEAHLANHGMDLAYGQGSASDHPHGEQASVDDVLRVLRVDDVDGEPLSAWVEFPVHLTASTPYNTLWDTEIAGPTLEHLADRLDAPGFVGLYSNGASGDLQPRFDAWNPQVLMDLHGRRLADGAFTAWRAAGGSLDGAMPVDVRWTKACYCGQEVEPGRSVSDEAVWGVPFLGGSEDGMSIFHETLGTEGKRRPAELADPVHGRKIPAAPSRPIGVHDDVPELQVLRLGDRLVLATPGEPSVEMARRFVAAVSDVLPAGVSEAFVVGLANGYLGYFVTPEEYDQQHYEGGHTVFGKWTSLLARDVLRALTASLRDGAPAPEPDEPPSLGGTDAGSPDVGDGGVVGAITQQPAEVVQRHGLVELTWTGGEQGVDRPVDDPFLVLERAVGDGWEPVETDLGLRFVWEQSDDEYRARYDVPGDAPLGRHRLRVVSGAYELVTRGFEVERNDRLRVLGARLDGSTLVFTAQNPPPDAERSVSWRPISPTGGTLTFIVGWTERQARWDTARQAWVAPAAGVRDGDTVVVPDFGLVDGDGNTSWTTSRFTVGNVAEPDWPDNIGVGGGRAPGPFGQGTFPP
ncbi:MAG: neutral/alkaline non-lysosomal ceramidase N-terminal domain-containing protein [Actinomycetes bacterium]